MAIRAIDTTQNQPKTASYMSAAAVGALGGYLAKHLIPVSSREYDVYVSQNVLKNRKKLTKNEITSLVKGARSNFDFAVISAVTLVALAFFKNMYNRLADKSN